jgi:hypothetical protein
LTSTSRRCMSEVAAGMATTLKCRVSCSASGSLKSSVSSVAAAVRSSLSLEFILTSDAEAETSSPNRPPDGAIAGAAALGAFPLFHSAKPKAFDGFAFACSKRSFSMASLRANGSSISSAGSSPAEANACGRRNPDACGRRNPDTTAASASSAAAAAAPAAGRGISASASDGAAEWPATLPSRRLRDSGESSASTDASRRSSFVGTAYPAFAGAAYVPLSSSPRDAIAWTCVDMSPSARERGSGTTAVAGSSA